MMRKRLLAVLLAVVAPAAMAEHTLDTTAKSIQVYSDGTASTEEPSFTVAFEDRSTPTSPPSVFALDGALNGTTPVTAIPAPLPGIRRQVVQITVFNADSATKVITVALVNSGTSRVLVRNSVSSGETLYYEDNSGWWLRTAAGATKVTVGSGGAGGAPTDAKYVTAANDATLTDDIFPSADDQVATSNSGTSASWKALPNGAVNYSTAGNTFSQASFSNILGTLALSQLTDDATSGLCLLSGGGGGDPNYATCPASGAPTDAQYVTLALNGTLSQERVLTGTTNQVIVTDGGAGGNVTLSTPQNIHTGATPTFTGMNFLDRLDISEIAEPAAPSADTIRLYAIDQNGYSVLEAKGSTDLARRLARDSIIVAKVLEAGGVSACQVVYLSGHTGANEEIKLAKADSPTTYPGFGLTLESGALNAFVRVVFGGKVTGCNTTGLSGPLFVSAATAGAYTTTAPSHPNVTQRIGFVTRDHASLGEILVQAVGIRGEDAGTNQSTFIVGPSLTNRWVLSPSTTASRTISGPDANAVVVQPDAGAANNFLTALSTGGVLSKAQPSFANISSTISAGQYGANSIAFGDIAPSTAPALLVGRRSTSAGNWEEITVGSGLAITSTNLLASLAGASCSNQFVTAISSTGTGTCSTATLASAQFANQGTTTTVLHGNAAGNPSWGSVVTGDIAANAITDGLLRQGSALSVIGRSANTTGNVADIAGTAGQVLRVSSAPVLGFGSIDLSQSATVGTSILGTANGGTGLDTSGASDDRVLVTNGDGTFSARALANGALTYATATNLFAQAGISNLASSLSADLRGVLSDETGTGAAMFGLTTAMADDLTCTGSQVVRRNAGDTAFECATISAGGAPTDAAYVTAADHASLSADVFPSADDQIASSNSASTASWKTLSNGAQSYNTGTNTFSQAGISNLAASPSADLRGVLSDETGTGAAMFGITTAMADEIPCAGSQGIRRNAGDTAWECFTPAAGGTPGGASGDVQYNDGAGGFAGNADFDWNNTNKTLTLGGTDTEIDVQGVTAEPSAPSSGIIRLYARSVAGRMLPKWVGPSGVDTAFQPALFNNRIVCFNPSTGTTGTGSGTCLGPAWTSNGTVTHPTPSSTAPAISNQTKRTQYTNVATTQNQQLGPRFNNASEQQFWRGNAAGLGGFFFQARFIVALIPASTIRIFAGLTSTATGSVVISNTVLNNTVGLWHDTTDPLSGANSFNLVTRDTTTTTKTSIALSNAIAAGNMYDWYMFCSPNCSTIFYRLTDVVNGVEYSGSTSTTLPANTAFMQPQVQMSNGTANVTVTTVAIGVSGIYVESDR